MERQTTNKNVKQRDGNTLFVLKIFVGIFAAMSAVAIWAKTANVTFPGAGIYYFAFYATNTYGTATDTVNSVDTASIQLIDMKSIVKNNGIITQGAIITLINTTNNTIIATSTADVNGQYLFTNLVIWRTYLLCGYSGTKRVMAKLKVPEALS